MVEMANKPIFLKLGGSLITDKDRPRTARFDTIQRLSIEIRDALRNDPTIQLLLGHGSGSFGHVPAKKYGTRQGVNSTEGWSGFLQVWRDAALLNRIVCDTLEAVGMPVISLPPSASIIAEDGAVSEWNLSPIRRSLEAGLLPVVFGDVIFDRKIGGTIFSTEDVFDYLARKLEPARILLAGIEPGVWFDFPDCTQIIPEITLGNKGSVGSGIGGSTSTDVTGGMSSKVTQSLELTKSIGGLEVQIFSGKENGNVKRALLGERTGTLITGRT